MVQFFYFFLGVADRVNLQPAWERVHEEIRKADDQHIVMFEGVTWDDVTLGFTRYFIWMKKNHKIPLPLRPLLPFF